MVLWQHPDHRLEDAILILTGRFAVEIDPRLVDRSAQPVFAIRGLDGIDVSPDWHELSDLFVGQHNDGHWHSPFLVAPALLAQQYAKLGDDRLRQIHGLAHDRIYVLAGARVDHDMTLLAGTR